MSFDKYSHMLSPVADVLTSMNTMTPLHRSLRVEVLKARKNAPTAKRVLAAPLDKVAGVMHLFGEHYAVDSTCTILFETTENGAARIADLLDLNGRQNSAWAPSPFLLGEETVR